jgi:methyl coenzyme M reductase beta subunit
MTIINRVLHQLASGEAKTVSQLLTTLPELTAEPRGAEVLRLLLRLDRRVRPLDSGRWTLAAAVQTPEDRIVASAQAYLNSIPGGGALVSSVVAHIVDETDYDQHMVRSVILRRFVNNRKVVRNRLKEAL